MATQLTGAVQVAAQGLFDESSTALHVLGELVHANDGRAFRYSRAGGTALVAGKLQQSSAEDTGTQNLTAVAASVGDTTISASTTVTITANEYAGGLAIITVTPGVGYAYRIKSHAAYTAAAPTLTLGDSIKVALTTSSRIDLVRNPFDGVIVNPTTSTSSPVGVAVKPITAAYYGWLQVAGIAAVLADGANAVGATLVASNAVAGAVEDAAAPNAQALVGLAHTGCADTEYGAVKLMLL